MIIKTIQPTYHKRMRFMPISTFEQLFNVGTKIEDALRDGKIKKEENNLRRKPMGGNYSNNHTNALDVNVLNKSLGKTRNPNPENNSHTKPRNFTNLNQPLS